MAAAAILTAVVLLVFFRDTGQHFHSRITNEAANRQRTEKSVPASPADRAAAEATLDRFVRTAVIRRDAEEAWDLATPQMQASSSRAAWKRGELPVVPYPAEQFRDSGATLKYSYRGVLGYDVLVLPKSSRGKQVVYACELHRLGEKWLVDWCYPRTTL